MCSKNDWESKSMTTKALMKYRHYKIILLNSLEMIVDFVPLGMVKNSHKPQHEAEEWHQYRYYPSWVGQPCLVCPTYISSVWSL